MLKEVDPLDYGDQASDLGEQSGALDLSRIQAAAHRQLKVVGLLGGVGLLAGLAYAFTAVPQYTATATLLIDGQKAGAVQDLANGAPFMFESAAVDSQVVVLRSERIVVNVIQRLKLLDRPEFTEAKPSVLGRVTGAVGDVFGAVGSVFGEGPEIPQQVKDYVTLRAAVYRLLGNLEVNRVQRTYAIEISFTSPDQNLAAQIANAFGEAYMEDQLGSKFDATKRTGQWMQSRIQELKQQALTSDIAVQRYKATENLASSSGQLLDDQALSQLSAQLVSARSDKTLADAKYRRIRAIIDNQETEAAIAESIANPVITDLRSKYLKASKLKADIARRFGEGHSQVDNLDKDMGEYQRLIFEELGRIAQSLQSDADIAEARVRSLEEQQATLTTQSFGNNQTLVNLRELEREAETYDTLYQEFLRRYQETIQRQSFPVSEARIITPAAIPLAPSAPRTGFIALGSLILGLFAGAGVGVIRELRDRGFRSTEQVISSLGLEPLGLLPMLSSDGGLADTTKMDTGRKLPLVGDLMARFRKTGAAAQRGRLGTQTAVTQRPRSPSRNTRGEPHGTAAVPLRQGEQPYRVIERILPIMAASLDSLQSRFAEVLRSSKVAIDIATVDRRPKVIGVVSLYPNEGKSTVSKNLASLIAHTGASTLLIDADLRNPGLSRSVVPEADIGLVEVILDGIPAREAMYVETQSGLHLLPTSDRQSVTHSSELLSSLAMRNFLVNVGRDYEYLIVDLPPMGPVVDARAASALFDGFVLVVEWGKTPRSTVRNTLRKEADIRRKTIGVILNKADPGRLNLYEEYGSMGYFDIHYDRYFKN
ncbi:GNVR domain-containing protein [Chthonobacter albigriseus]|uniref:GNVR domain-containing protein n=1 Tax=Chthonobacter albigriseus TaxID=1683161 RepID=UPI0015EEE025|nr:GNVR domain-containing protein [Chthonobacter albigriseus]